MPVGKDGSCGQSMKILFRLAMMLYVAGPAQMTAQIWVLREFGHLLTKRQRWRIAEQSLPGLHVNAQAATVPRHC